METEPMADATNNKLSASLEDYLEAILWIVRKKSAAQARDISKRLKVTRSSVTGALHALADRELINYAPYDVVTLTDKGRVIAEKIIRRHEALRDFFTNVLLIGRKEADAAACKVEHAIPEPVFKRLTKFAKYVEDCPHCAGDWLEDFDAIAAEDDLEPDEPVGSTAEKDEHASMG
jgi:DtxR family Mn-dependent transcriptional regulator